MTMVLPPKRIAKSRSSLGLVFPDPAVRGAAVRDSAAFRRDQGQERRLVPLGVRRSWPVLFLALPGIAAAEGACTSLDQADFMLGAWRSETQGTLVAAVSDLEGHGFELEFRPEN